MRTLAVLAFALAACGGGKKAATPDTTPPAPTGARVAGPGEVVGDAALYAQVKTSTIALPAGPADMQCAGAATLGAQVAAWEQAMGGPINAHCEGAHCTIELASPIDPSCDANADQEGCDGSSEVIEFDRDGNGAIVAGSLVCMAAG